MTFGASPVWTNVDDNTTNWSTCEKMVQISHCVIPVLYECKQINLMHNWLTRVVHAATQLLFHNGRYVSLHIVATLANSKKREFPIFKQNWNNMPAGNVDCNNGVRIWIRHSQSLYRYPITTCNIMIEMIKRWDYWVVLWQPLHLKNFKNIAKTNFSVQIVFCNFSYILS